MIGVNLRTGVTWLPLSQLPAAKPATVLMMMVLMLLIILPQFLLIHNQ